MESIRILFKNNAPSVEDDALDILEKYYNPEMPNAVSYPFFVQLNVDKGSYVLRTYLIRSGEPKMISAAEFLQTYDKFMNTPILKQ